MNWDAISAIGQMLGSVAVFVTVVYLALQIKHARIAQNAASFESVNQGFNSINALLSADESLTRIILKGNDDLGSLNPVERYRYFATHQSYANQYAQMFSLFKVGVLSKEDWELHLDSLVAGSLPKYRGIVNMPADLWTAMENYGSTRHLATGYFVASANLD